MYVDQQKQLEDPLLLCCVVGDSSLWTPRGLITMLFIVNMGLELLSPSEIPWTVHSRCLSLVLGGWLGVHIGIP